MTDISDERPPLQQALARSRDPGMLSFGLGLPAAELFPMVELREASEAVFEAGPLNIQYNAPVPRLKEHIVQMMKLRGVSCTEDEVFLTSGAQQGLSLLAQLLCSSTGDRIGVNEVFYPGLRQVLGPSATIFAAIPRELAAPDDVRRLREALKGGSSASLAFLYAMSVGHNPLGLTMEARMREALVGCAKELQVSIVEDDVYGFLQYGADAAPPLRALDAHNVYYIGSFSKLIAPALRVGWIVAPRHAIARLSVLKEGSDLDVATVAQGIVCRYLDSHPLMERIEFLRKQYRARRDAMHEALLKHLPQAQWTRPSAGFYFWVESAAFGNTTALLKSAVDHNVIFIPGSAFSATDDPRHDLSVRLSFSSCPIGSIDEGIGRIAALQRSPVALHTSH
jgi:2-aminoadipate transaminase